MKSEDKWEIIYDVCGYKPDLDYEPTDELRKDKKKWDKCVEKTENIIYIVEQVLDKKNE